MGGVEAREVCEGEVGVICELSEVDAAQSVARGVGEARAADVRDRIISGVIDGVAKIVDGVPRERAVVGKGPGTRVGDLPGLGLRLRGGEVAGLGAPRRSRVGVRKPWPNGNPRHALGVSSPESEPLAPASSAREVGSGLGPSDLVLGTKEGCIIIGSGICTSLALVNRPSGPCGRFFLDIASLRDVRADEDRRGLAEYL